MSKKKQEILTLEQLEKIITPLSRKYDWNAEPVEGGFEVTITDGLHESKGFVDTADDIEVIVRGLEKDVDGQDYPTL